MEHALERQGDTSSNFQAAVSGMNNVHNSNDFVTNKSCTKSEDDIQECDIHTSETCFCHRVQRQAIRHDDHNRFAIIRFVEVEGLERSRRTATFIP